MVLKITVYVKKCSFISFIYKRNFDIWSILAKFSILLFLL